MQGRAELLVEGYHPVHDGVEGAVDRLELGQLPLDLGAP